MQQTRGISKPDSRVPRLLLLLQIAEYVSYGVAATARRSETVGLLSYVPPNFLSTFRDTSAPRSAPQDSFGTESGQRSAQSIGSIGDRTDCSDSSTAKLRHVQCIYLGITFSSWYPLVIRLRTRYTMSIAELCAPLYDALFTRLLHTPRTSRSPLACGPLFASFAGFAGLAA